MAACQKVNIFKTDRNRNTQERDPGRFSDCRHGFGWRIQGYTTEKRKCETCPINSWKMKKKMKRRKRRSWLTKHWQTGQWTGRKRKRSKEYCK